MQHDEPGPDQLESLRLARLSARTPPDVEIRAHRGEAALPTVRHELVVGQVDDGWLARLPAGAHFVRVDDPVGVEEKRSLSDEQRRELEALGYIE